MLLKASSPRFLSTYACLLQRHTTDRRSSKIGPNDGLLFLTLTYTEKCLRISIVYWSHLCPKEAVRSYRIPIPSRSKREWARLRKKVGRNIVCRQGSQGEKAVNYRTQIYKVNFILHLLCSQHHKNFLKGISGQEKEVESTRLFKHPSTARFLYLSANMASGVLIYPELSLQLERRKISDFLVLTN